MGVREFCDPPSAVDGKHSGISPDFGKSNWEGNWTQYRVNLSPEDLELCVNYLSPYVSPN